MSVYFKGCKPHRLSADTTSRQRVKIVCSKKLSVAVTIQTLSLEACSIGRVPETQGIESHRWHSIVSFQAKQFVSIAYRSGSTHENVLT